MHSSVGSDKSCRCDLQLDPVASERDGQTCLTVLSVTHPCSPKGNFASELEVVRITSKKPDNALSLQDFTLTTCQHFRRYWGFYVSLSICFDGPKRRLAVIQRQSLISCLQGVEHVFVTIDKHLSDQRILISAKQICNIGCLAKRGVHTFWTFILSS